MRHSRLYTAGNVARILRTERRSMLALLATYSRLKLEEFWSGRQRADGIKSTRILDMPVSFFDYYWLVEMFEEIFVRQHYFFEAETSRPLIIDVGSNIGLAILFFKRLYPAARVIGFEPDPDAFEVLTRNITENRLEGVQVLNEAVHGGRDRIYLYSDPGTAASPQTSTRSERIGSRRREVPATRLSDHISGPVDFLKLDVEGAETVVIEDLERASALQAIARMAIEYHHHIAPDDDGLGGMLAALERSGFGYQLEARLERSPGAHERHFQNVLIHAYRKDAVRAPSRSRTNAQGPTGVDE
jgi:FkbM family methyltransferase